MKTARYRFADSPIVSLSWRDGGVKFTVSGPNTAERWQVVTFVLNWQSLRVMVGGIRAIWQDEKAARLAVMAKTERDLG